MKARLKSWGHCAAQLTRDLMLISTLSLAGCTAADPSTSHPNLHYSAEDAVVDPAIIYAEQASEAGLDYREGWFQDGDTRLHFVEAGDGPLMVLYHGFPSYWLSWRDQFEAFADDYRVVALDALGAGLSDKPEEADPYQAEALAAQLDRFTEALSPDEPFILIGHDWGSVLSLGYAQSRPERLRAVIGMSAPPLNNLLAQLAISPEQQAISNYMQQFGTLTREDIEARGLAQQVAEQSYAKLASDGELSDAEIALFHASVGRTEAVHGGMNWYRANIPPWDAIDGAAQWPGPDARLDLPALFIWGEADQIFLPEIIDNLLIAEPNLRIARLPGIGHWTSMDQPHLANQAIQDFLDTLETTP